MISSLLRKNVFVDLSLAILKYPMDDNVEVESMFILNHLCKRAYPNRSSSRCRKASSTNQAQAISLNIPSSLCLLEGSRWVGMR